ncbi:MAG: TlpA family protein disulfide reductase [Crocinitomicaceae bacterium]
MNQIFGYIILLLITGFSAAATTIHGFAPEFIGEKVIMYTYSDFLTLNKVVLGEAVVEAKDSSFSIHYEGKRIYKVLLEIENTNAEIYLQPSSHYEIYYKRGKDYANAFGSQKATTYFKNLDTSDINYKVLQYSNWFDEYLYLNQEDILRGGIAPYIDTFKMYAYEAYAKETNPYFVNYVRYNIATLEKLKVGARYRKPKVALYMEYIKPFPVFAFNDQYMDYLKGFYSNNFNSFDNQIQSDIVLAIHHSSPSRLMTAMHRDPYYDKDEIRELMMVRMLGNAYYTNQYKKKNIKVMLDSVADYAKFRSSGLAANNILKEVTSVATGYPAPQFEFEWNGESVKLSQYKDKFVYVNFFAKWNTESVKEMLILEELVATYGDYIQFVSFCVDKSEAEYEAFMKEHPNLNWPIVYLGERHEISKEYQVASIPYFILIDQSGFISSAPALSPSPDGLNRTIETTFKFIKSKLD